MSFVKFPLKKTDIDIFCGFYHVRVGFTENDGQLGVFFSFLEGPFDDSFPAFPFRGSILLCLKRYKNQIGSLKEGKAVPSGDFCAQFPSSHSYGWVNFCSMQSLQREIEGDKLWFSVVVARKE